MTKIKKTVLLPDIVKGLGLSLCFLGATLGMFLNFYGNLTGVTTVLVIIGLLFLTSYRTIISHGLPSFSIGIALIVLFHLICIALILVGRSQMPSYILNQNFTYHFFTLGFCIALTSNVLRDNKTFDIFISCLWLVSLACAVLSFYSLIGGYYLNYVDNNSFRDDSKILESLTMGNALQINVLCSLFVADRGKMNKFLAICSLLLDIIVLLMLGKRTPIFISIMIIVFYIGKKYSIKQILSLHNILILTVVIALFILIFQNNQFLRGLIREFFQNFYSGINDMLFGTKTDLSGSAKMRYNSRQDAINIIRNFSFSNYIFGAGYMTKWIDNPLLQSYLDLGIYGFIMYLFFVVLKPMITIFKTNNKYIIFGCLLCFYNVFSSMSSGNPYSFLKWDPTIFLLFLLNNKSILEERRIERLDSMYTLHN